MKRWRRRVKAPGGGAGRRRRSGRRLFRRPRPAGEPQAGPPRPPPAENQTGKRRVVVALRERGGRTFTHVTTTEAEGVKIAFQTAEDKTTFYADEASHWDALPDCRWPVRRINHSQAYSDLNGTSTNQVESYFSRLRRMVDGQHHHVSARYLHAYAAQAAWMEDHRRLSNGTLCYRALGLALAHPVSRQWKGYWQRARR